MACVNVGVNQARVHGWFATSIWFMTAFVSVAVVMCKLNDDVYEVAFVNCDGESIIVSAVLIIQLGAGT